MADLRKYVQNQKSTTYGSGCAVAATSITLTNFTQIDGTLLTMTDFGTKGYGTLEPGNTVKEEQISFTGITQNANGTATLTGVSHVLFVAPYTETSGVNLSHVGGVTFVVSNTAAFYDGFTNKNDDESITGIWSFSASPNAPSPTNATDVANKAYVDGGILSGGADASTTVKGVSRVTYSPNVTLGNPTISIATPAVISLASHGLTVNDTIQLTTTGALPTGLSPSTTYYVISAGLVAGAFEVSATQGGAAVNTSGTQSGTHTLIKTTPVSVASTDPLLPISRFNLNYLEDTGAANAYVLTPSPAISALVDGMTFSFRAANANTTTATLNINGLGAKVIYKLQGTTALASGDIASGMNVAVQYENVTDSFRMTNPTANTPTVATTPTNIQTFSAAGTTTWTKPTGAKWVEVTVIGAGGAGGSGSVGANTSGGGGGAYGFKRFNASVLGSTESYTVGAGGVAGANGTTGGPGGFSSFGTTLLIEAPGGSGGGNTTASGGVPGNGDITFAGGASNINGAAGVDTANTPSPRGGGSGGYNNSSPANAIAGGNGGAFTTYYTKAGGAGGVAGVNNGVAATTTNSGLIYGGVGGGGGGYNGNGTNTGGNGGVGGFPGGGGGGSSGTNNVGGNGADGMVVVVTYF